jgi:hypothetical protein
MNKSDMLKPANNLAKLVRGRSIFAEAIKQAIALDVQRHIAESFLFAVVAPKIICKGCKVLEPTNLQSVQLRVEPERSRCV